METDSNSPDAAEPHAAEQSTEPTAPILLDDAGTPTDAPSDAPIGEAPGEDGDASHEADVAPSEGGPLAELADRSAKGRLSPPDEEQAVGLIVSLLKEDREGLAKVVEQLPRLPWVIAVNGVSAAWPELKPAVRNRLLASLALVESDAARRVRLSLARGLFKLDAAVGVKLAASVAKELRDKETGAVSPKSAQIFANVLIGRAKPWIAQLPLAELKLNEADTLVNTALLAVFGLPHTPVTQLGVIKWAAAAGKLAKLQPGTIETINKGLNRWSGKWQGVLRREVEGLPEEILADLKPEQAADQAPQQQAEPSGRRSRRNRGPREEPEAEPTAAADSAESPDAERDPRDLREPRDERDEEEDERHIDDQIDQDEEDAIAAAAAAPERRKQRPVYESKTVPNRGSKPQTNFNLNDALRQIDAHVASLRSELATAQSKLRQREPREVRKPERGNAPVIPGELSAEELARLNVQLEARNAELQQRIEDLTVDSEDRAAAAALATDSPVTDEGKRLRHLLALKLQESFDDYCALENESPDIVAPKHYRTVLGRVFQVLAGEEIFNNVPDVVEAQPLEIPPPIAPPLSEEDDDEDDEPEFVARKKKPEPADEPPSAEEPAAEAEPEPEKPSE